MDAEELVTDPHAADERLRREGPVVRVHDARGLDHWLVTRYDEARTALGDARLRWWRVRSVPP